jgi:hypothetical protein
MCLPPPHMGLQEYDQAIATIHDGMHGKVLGCIEFLANRTQKKISIPSSVNRNSGMGRVSVLMVFGLSS